MAMARSCTCITWMELVVFIGPGSINFLVVVDLSDADWAEVYGDRTDGHQIIEKISEAI